MISIARVERGLLRRAFREHEGRLAEVLGPKAVERDRQARLLKYRGPFDDSEWTSYHKDAKRIFTAYANGINWRAMAALAIAIAPVVPGFVRAALTPGGHVASPTIWDSLYTYAWFVTFAISFTVYFGLMRTTRRRV